MVIGPDEWRLAFTAMLAIFSGLLEMQLIYIITSISLSMSGGVDARPAFLAVPFGQPSRGGLLVFAALLIVGAIALSFPLARLSASLSARAIVRLRKRTVAAFLSSSMRYRVTHNEGWLQQLIGEYCLRSETVVQQLASISVSGSVLVVLICGALAIDIKMAICLLLLLSTSGILLRTAITRVRKQSAIVVAFNKAISSRIAEVARLSKEIVAFDVGDSVEARIGLDVRQGGDALRRMYTEGKQLEYFHIYSGISLILVFIAMFSTLRNSQTAVVAAVAMLLVRALSYLRQLLNAGRLMMELSPYLTKLIEELTQMESQRRRSGSTGCLRFTELELINVGVLGSDGHPVLHGLNLKIREGESLAIVGHSGSGKSTLCSLLLGIEMPTQGTILADGIPLDEISARAWSSIAAYIPQDVNLIAGTIADNIRFFRSGLDLQLVEAAARDAHIHEDISRLPEGYQTVIGPGARGLSGGQAQRLAIARALVGHPQLLVLDEPTSALDRQSESSVVETLIVLKGSVTIVVATHSPNLLHVCDRVLHLSHGGLIEDSGAQTGTGVR